MTCQQPVTYVGSRRIYWIHCTREWNETYCMNIMWTADIQMKWRCDHHSCDCDLIDIHMLHSFHGYIEFNKLPAPNIWVFIARLVEHCSANAEAMISNPVEALKTTTVMITSSFQRTCWSKSYCKLSGFLGANGLKYLLWNGNCIHSSLVKLWKFVLNADQPCNTKTSLNRLDFGWNDYHYKNIPVNSAES